MDTMSGLCTPARENLDVTTVTDNNGADDMVRIEPQRLGAGSAPGPTAPDLLDLSLPHRVSSNSPRVWESPHVASTPPTSSPTPAAAPSSNPDPHLIDAVVCSPPRWPSPGRPQARWATPACAGVGPAPQGRGAPPPASAEHTHPRAGVAGDRIRLARRRAATGWQFTQLGAQPCAHPVAGACGSNPPIVCLGRHHQTQPPSHGRGGSQPPHPLTTRLVSTAPAVRPGTGGAKPPGAICCQVMHQPTPVTVSALPSSYDAAGSTAARAAGGAVHRDGATSAAGGSRPGAAAVTAAAVGVATTPPPP